MELSIIQTVVVYLLPVIFAITLHEAAHGYAAKRFGDETAWQLGRVSLNPLRHIDLVGTILVPLAMLALSGLAGGGGVLFGWAKPVPVNFGRLGNPKRDMRYVAAAGPAANLLMALGWGLLYKLALTLPENSFTLPMLLMGTAGISTNLMFMVLNLLPLPPLDGGRILISLLPAKLAYKVAKIEPYGFVILMLLVFMGGLNILIVPVVDGLEQMLLYLFS